MHPILEYGSSVRDPHPEKLQEELEKVQNRAARFVTRNYVYETGSMTGRWSISIGVPLYLHTDGDRSHRCMCRNLN